ncbi:ankyrin repeat-containing domain protein [Annulohypoxylon moriforme]|nr:ankyrin repeat-containing domain protein [Annulohypoxylon moriforme]
MQPVMIELLNTKSGHRANANPIAISFAENTFLACLEADNIDVVQYLLHHQFIDANTAICLYNGQRYTPLEFAAIQQSSKIIRFLISKGVDINKSLSRPGNCNALHLLIEHMGDRRSTIDDDSLNLVRVFIDAKATISTYTIELTLRLFSDPKLATRLAENVASQAPQKLISHEYLIKKIVENLEEQDAMRIIKLIISRCQDLGEDSSLDRFRLDIPKILAAAAERGYYELLGILLPPTSSQIKTFQTAMEVEDRETDELSQQEDLSLEALICALRSGDNNRLRSPKVMGALTRFHGHMLGQVLTEALKAGNWDIATEILDLDPEFRFYDCESLDLEDSQIFNVAAALDAALAHHFNDIAWKVLAIGLTTKTPNFRNHEPPPLLYVALERNKPEFVKAIIEFGFGPGLLGRRGTQGQSILEMALRYEDDSIFDALWKTRPSQIYVTDGLFELALEKGRRDYILDFARCSEVVDYGGPSALRIAVMCEDESMLDELIMLGAKVDDDIALEEAINNHPSMIEPLLKRYWKAYPQGRPGYGEYIVRSALEIYSTSPETLDMLIAWNHTSPFFGNSFLRNVINTRDYSIVKKVVDAGCDANCIEQGVLFGDGSRITPLLDAISTGDLEITQLLIQSGAEVNRPTGSGVRRTPLQKAAEMNNIPMVRLLLENYADVNAAPARIGGATALQFAAIHGNCEMATILIEHGASQNVPPSIGGRERWPLEGAAENGRLDMLELLWNAPGDPIDEKQCRNAMRLAENNGHIGCKKKIEELMARSSMRNSMAPRISWST